MGEYEKITIRMSKELIRKMDELVELDDFSSRSEVARVAVRDMVYEKANNLSDRLKR